MHVYIYDRYVTDRRYQTVLARIETRLTDLGLNGKIVRLGIMQSLDDVVESELKKGAKTIVAVGNDHLFFRAIDAVARLGAVNPIHRVTPLGFIPVGAADNALSAYLGIELEERAADIISARRIEPLDLGRAGERYFLTAAAIGSAGTTVSVDNTYALTVTAPGEIFVVNLPLSPSLQRLAPADPTDGRLELCIRTESQNRFTRRRKTSVTRLPFHTLTIDNPNAPLVIDGATNVPTPATVRVAPDQVRMIVGKHRHLIEEN